MVSADFAQIMSLHAGEAYAVQNLTRTDRLALLLSGKVSHTTAFISIMRHIKVMLQVNVLSDNQFLHPILPCEFLDSPEFESSRNTVDDKFKVIFVLSYRLPNIELRRRKLIASQCKYFTYNAVHYMYLN